MGESCKLVNVARVSKKETCVADMLLAFSLLWTTLWLKGWGKPVYRGVVLNHT